jgi:hypothetical protein
MITERYKLGVWIDPGPIDKYKRRDNRQRFPNQLFDREEDPLELTNLINNPSYAKVRNQLKEHFNDFTSRISDAGKMALIKKHGK